MPVHLSLLIAAANYRSKCFHDKVTTDLRRRWQADDIAADDLDSTMTTIKANLPVLLLIAGFVLAPASATYAQTPAAIAATGAVVLTLHAEGAQVYECKADASGKIAWVFREPIATLLAGGKTVGRHYAGPNWEYSDGSAVVGKATGNAPGATEKDIPWLKLDVVSQRGSGVLSGITTVQRINTAGGKLQGACDKPGTYQNVPYSADYVFLKAP